MEGESSGSNIIPAKFSVKMFLGHYQVLTTISLQLKCTLQENQKIQTYQLVYELPEKKHPRYLHIYCRQIKSDAP